MSKIFLYIFYILVITVFIVAIVQNNWTAIAALAALAAVGVAIYQALLTRMTIGADLIMKLEDRFEEKSFLESREKAKRALKSNTEENKDHIENVFDFFETIGLLVRKKALDKELAWNSFFYWLHGYYRFAQSFIGEQQKDYPNRYIEVVWLHKELMVIEKKKGRINEREWDEFLDEEIGSE
jgi:hypothetical protein